MKRRRTLERSTSAASSGGAGSTHSTRLSRAASKRRGYIHPWQLNRMERQELWPAGPASVDELMNWPQAIIRGLQMDTEAAAGAEMLARLHTHMLRTSTWVTDYSGIDCVRECTERMVEACITHCGWHFEKNPMVFLRSCDCGDVQSGVLTSIAIGEDSSRSCHFRDLRDRLPQPGQEYLEAAMPGKKATTRVKEEAFRHIAEWVSENKGWLFPKDATSPCYVHGIECAVFPSLKADETSAAGGQHEQHDGHDGDHAEDGEDAGADDRPLRISAAGVSCQGWSGEGLGQPKAHFSEVPHSIWLQEREVVMDRQQEDLCFSECTPRYPAAERYDACLGSKAKMVSLLTGPELMGWPCRRMRKLTAIINKKSLVWMGPDSEEGVERDFKERFYRGVVLDGSAFFCADNRERFAEYSALAANRKNQLDEEMIGCANNSQRILAAVLPPGAIGRLREYEEHRLSHDQAGVLMCDADHNKGCGSTCGPDWPVQLTHGSIVMLKDAEEMGTMNWTLATWTEHFESMGFIMRQREGGLPISKMKQYLVDLPTWQKKFLCGNGMHLTTQAAFQLYVLCNVVKTDYRLPKAMTTKRTWCKRSSWMMEGDDEDTVSECDTPTVLETPTPTV